MGIIKPLPESEERRFERLVRPHIEPLYRLAYRLCRHPHDAEDLVQSLMIKIYPRRGEIDDERGLRTWLTRGLYRLYIDRLRQQQRTPTHEAQAFDALEERWVGGEPDPETQTARQQQQTQIQAALDQLPEEQRLLINFHDVEGYTLAELATVLDTPVGTLKSRLHRARAKLKSMLDAPGTLSA